MKKNILSFILGAIIFSSLTVFALNISARDTAYDNTNSGSSATNMQDAIDDLYNRSGSKVDLLWQNSNPSAPFYPQTITVDYSDYDAIIIKLSNGEDESYNLIDVSNITTSRTITISISNMFRSITIPPTKDAIIVNRAKNRWDYDYANDNTYATIARPLAVWGIKEIDLSY